MSWLNDLFSGDAKLLNKIKAQDFREQDSQIVSALMNPKKAGGKLADWMGAQVSTAAGLPVQPTDEGDIYAREPDRLSKAMAGLNIAGFAQGGSMPFAPPSAGGTLGTFIGPKAANWNKKAAATATQLLDNGADPAQVWKEHLIGRMPDKSLFSEIDDSGSKLMFPEDFKQKIIEKKDEEKTLSELIKSIKETKKVQSDIFPKELNSGITNLTNKKKEIINDIERDFGLEWGATGYNGARLKYALDHGELPNSYPELSDNVIVRLGRDDGSGLRGYYNNNSMTINAIGNRDKDWTPTSTALHESQHAIQDLEGWARGGSPESMISESLSTPEAKYNAYRRLTGEAQARATQDRMNLNMQQRRDSYPLAKGLLADIKLKDLINRYGN